jgi:hypothetical protein
VIADAEIASAGISDQGLKRWCEWDAEITPPR